MIASHQKQARVSKTSLHLSHQPPYQNKKVGAESETCDQGSQKRQGFGRGKKHWHPFHSTWECSFAIKRSILYAWEGARTLSCWTSKFVSLAPTQRTLINIYAFTPSGLIQWMANYFVPEEWIPISGTTQMNGETMVGGFREFLDSPTVLFGVRPGAWRRSSYSGFDSEHVVEVEVPPAERSVPPLGPQRRSVPFPSRWKGLGCSPNPMLKEEKP